MSERNAAADMGLSSRAWALPVLLLLFVGSGCAALVYEIVWFQLLQQVIGASAVSFGVLLGTFMGGMCLGSLLFPYAVSARRHPLRVYAVLELGIGLFGIVLLYAMPLVARQYVSGALGVSGYAGIFLRGAVCAICLLPPTVLMGATLPAIARWMKTTPQGIAVLGFFYGANIAGAVCGCLLAGFYLLRLYDVTTATFAAAAINLGVGLLGLGLSAVLPYEPPADARSSPARTSVLGTWPVYATIMLSGLAALGAEVVWTRLLSLMLGATVYTFSIILAVFLVGLGIGSSVGSLLARGSVNPRAALGGCQLLLTAAVAWTAWMLAQSLPYWPVDVRLSTSPWLMFQLDIVRCAWAVLPPACLWGASFPLAVAAAATDGKDPGRLVGKVYAANTVGAIVGAVGFSMLTIAWLGTQRAQQALIGVSALAALLMFVPLAWQAWRRFASGRSQETPVALTPAAAAIASLLVLLTIAAAGIVYTVPPAPRALIAMGRKLPSWGNWEPEFLYVGEGMNASIAVTESLDEENWNIERDFHVSGKVVASNIAADMRLQRMLGHLSALMHARPKSVLVVGCGAGVTAGAFVQYPDVQRIVICEIEPLIPPAARRYFGEENHHVLNDKRTEVVLDDARHYVLTCGQKFDIVTSDPIHPWVKGAASLYSREYFELCKQRLNPGGVVTQWVPLYESNAEAVKSQIATFLEVFPEGTIWSSDKHEHGYDLVLLARVEPTVFDIEQIQERLERDDHAEAKRSLKEVGLDSGIALAETYAGRKADLQPWLADAQINLDRNLRLQYLAGFGLNLEQAGDIFSAMKAHRKYPEGLFVATTADERRLRKEFEAGEAPEAEGE